MAGCQPGKNVREHPAKTGTDRCWLQSPRLHPPERPPSATLHPISHNRHQGIDPECIQVILGQRRGRVRECQRRQRRPECPA